MIAIVLINTIVNVIGNTTIKIIAICLIVILAIGQLVVINKQIKAYKLDEQRYRKMIYGDTDSKKGEHDGKGRN